MQGEILSAKEVVQRRELHSGIQIEPFIPSQWRMQEFTQSDFVFSHPEVEDAPWIWRLVRETGVLDPNSCYLYLLLCRDFADSCLVARRTTDRALAGFVTAYRPPQRSDVLFVWQIGVSTASRRCGLARRMLGELLARCDEPPVKFIEATVAPSNTASRRLFESLARDLQAPLNDAAGFDATDFRFGNHESEPSIRIGPIV